MTHIFVSYSSKNRAIVQDICRILAENDVSMWVDFLNIQIGEHWNKKIADALDECHSGVLFLSKDAIESNECVAEYRKILEKKKPLYVVRLEDVEIPYPLNAIQVLDFFPNIENGMRKLLEIIKKANPTKYVDSFAEAEIKNVRKNETAITSVGDILVEYYSILNERIKARDNFGLPTGFRDFDTILNGFQRQQLILVGACPDVGLSSFLFSLCSNVNRFCRLALFSLQLEKIDTLERIISMETGIPTSKLSSGRITEDEAKRFVEVVNRIDDYDFFLHDIHSSELNQMIVEIKDIKETYGLDLVFIDYLQLIISEGDFPDKDKIRFVISSLKKLARRLNISIVIGMQLPKSIEKRANKKPILKDIDDIADIKHLCDVIAFVYREEIYDEATEFPNQADVIIAKHRNGPTGTVSLYFEKSLTKFMDASVHRVDLSGLE
jgi:replicative DNA helicase